MSCEKRDKQQNMQYWVLMFQEAECTEHSCAVLCCGSAQTDRRTYERCSGLTECMHHSEDGWMDVREDYWFIDSRSGWMDEWIDYLTDG